jgi:periplasmic protein CpxP/Spy
MFRKLVLAFVLAVFACTALPFAVAQDTNGQSSTGATEQQSSPSGAQRGGRGARHFDPAQRTERLTKRLRLNSDQQSKVQQILTSEQSQMKQLHSDSSLSQQDRRSKMMDIHKTSNDQIRALLDSDQQQKWDKMQQKHEERMQKHREGGQAPSAAPDSGQPQAS